MGSSLKDSMQMFAIHKMLDYLNEDPDKALPKMMALMDKYDKDDIVLKQRNQFRKIISDPNNNFYKLLKSLWTDIDDDVRRTIFENFIVNATIKGGKIQRKLRKEYDCNFPWAILMDPTSACNLHCTGCWAADYGNKLNLSYEQLDDIINQAKELGTYMFIYTGGEPLIRKDDIIKLCEAHPDCQFLSFTNATLIDEKFADDMLRVKNFIPAMSVEGFEDATDFRRGEGTYAAIVKAMKILKAKKLPFGVSCCYTSKNTDVIGSEEYFDWLVEMGAKFAWLFTFMPIGVDTNVELMASPEQREFMYNQVRKFRSTKPIFTLDFWNDGEFVNGCIAGGRYYIHINSNGDMEPCAFIHYSDSNIKDKTLLEAYQSPLFMEYHKNQPFSDNLLRPCPLLDNYCALADMVDRSGAHSTDLQKPEDVHDLCDKCKTAAANWKETADRIWNKKD